jgi:hypothetical protein
LTTALASAADCYAEDYSNNNHDTNDDATNNTINNTNENIDTGQSKKWWDRTKKKSTIDKTICWPYLFSQKLEIECRFG